jgi:tRNA dimethylallyltransferase
MLEGTRKKDTPMGLKYDILVITGPTASGKTSLAAALASRIGGEIISADSRQVYRKMNLGTGKDYDEYIVGGSKIAYHLIDIADPGYKYSVYEYQRDFLKVLSNMRLRNKLPVVCGGSGMYIDSVISGYRLIEVPPDKEFRASLADKSLEDLTEILAAYKKLHNKTDTDTRKRAIRAIEIERYIRNSVENRTLFPEINPLVVGVSFSRETRRERITERLKQRFELGMVDEVRDLLNQGVTPEDLMYYGLEYKYVTLHILGHITHEEMFRSLETAIHRFAKRQMTWFRGMERKGIKIHWIDGELPLAKKIDIVMGLLF